MQAEDILSFWFREISPQSHWQKDSRFDAMITQRFRDCHRAARAGELSQWRDSAAGALAEIIVLDQFSRNMFRDRPEAFASDGMALVLAQEAVRRRLDENLDILEKPFLYMPYMHSESIMIHEQALPLFRQPGLEKNLDFELRHRDIILRFGRYPHRNTILGRVSTGEEKKFLEQPGSGF